MPKHAPKGPIKARDPKDTTDLVEGLTYRPCVATSRTTGNRCRRRPIPGGTVCRFHGGAAPQVKLKALERLEQMQAMALARLAQLAEDESFPSTSYQAVRDILDRTMGKPTETVKQEHSGGIAIRHEQIG